MLEKINLDKVFFIDIETVPQYSSYSEADENSMLLWNDKAESFKRNEPEITAEEVYERAGIYAEFGKIICISVGIFKYDNDQLKFRLKSFYGDDEVAILKSFHSLLTNYFNPKFNYLCAHNGKEFDFPYIARRMIVHGIELPEALDNWGKKPWETEHLLDTMHLWRFGDYKSYTSLKLLCHILNIPTPKDDISGKDVWRVYYEEKNLERIVKYCEKDVLAIARLLQKFKRLDIIDDQNVEIA